MPAPHSLGHPTHTYREDIDRLRGLAVLSVVGFHFGAPGIHGGFVGVDIFFVISGFLITQIIQREIRSGSFSFVAFYERRIRRLLPALYLVVLISIVPALFLLLASERLSFFRSVIAVVTFTSNILFWSQSGYFDRTAVEKPLLHTWSLSVEEQFYLAFPVLIWALRSYAGHWRRPELVVTIPLVAILVASFAFGLWLLQSGHAASSFYMSPARAWEFLIGSLIAVEGFPILKQVWQRHVVLVISYILMLVPIFGLRQQSVFPGWAALAPCLGAALFIWSGSGARPVERHRFSPYRLARFFGTISYSMYLWHWPLFTFARFAKDGLTLSGTDKLLLFATTVTLSYISWAFIEQPFRRRQLLTTRKLAFAGASAASLALIAMSAIGINAPVATSEFDRTLAKLDSYNSFDERTAYRGDCFRVVGAPIDFERCMTLSPTQTNALLWGDSHAAHYYPGLAKLAEGAGFHLLQSTQAGCTPIFQLRSQNTGRCPEFNDLTSAWFTSNRPDVVILSGDWMNDVFSSRFDMMIGSIRRTTAELNTRDIHVVLIGPAIQFKTGLPDIVIRALYRNGSLLPVKDMVRADIFAGDAKMKAALPDAPRFRYISVVDAVCPNELCPVIVGNGIPLTWDYGHLTVEGSEYVVQKVDLLGSLKKEQR